MFVEGFKEMMTIANIGSVLEENVFFLQPYSRLVGLIYIFTKIFGMNEILRLAGLPVC